MRKKNEIKKIKFEIIIPVVLKNLWELFFIKKSNVKLTEKTPKKRINIWKIIFLSECKKKLLTTKVKTIPDNKKT